MSRPTLKVEAAFGHGPFDTSKTWTDLTSRAISVSAKHGRDSELASFQAGSMTVTLDGSDRHLDPTYAAGPYYGDLKPMVPIRSYWEQPADEPLVVDAFTRSDSTTDLGSASPGGAWSTIAFGGTGDLGISSNQAYCSTVDPFATVGLIDMGEADGYAEMTYIPNGAFTGSSLVFRGDIAAVSVWQVLITSATSVVLAKTVGGVFTAVGSATVASASSYALRVEFSGTSIRVLLDGVEIIAATDSALSTATEVGFTLNTTAPRIDNFEAGTIGTTTYPVGYGYAQAWPQDYEPPAKCTVRVQCPDVFSVLANAPLVGGSPLASLIAADSPTHWYRFDDEEGASYFADEGSDPTLGIVRGTRTPGFGSAGLDLGDTAATAWRSQAGDGGSGWLDAATNLGTSWDTLFVLFNTEDPGHAGLPVLLADQSNIITAASTYVGAERTGDTGATGRAFALFGTSGHEITRCVMLRRTGGSPKWAIYVDGVEAAQTDTAVGGHAAASATTQIGARRGLNASNYGRFAGTIQHLALFSTNVTANAASYYQATLGWDDDLTGERIGHVLDAVGHPTAERDLDDGTILLGPTDWSDTQRALGELQAVEKTEQGKLYQRPDGVLVFQQRHAWVTATRSSTSQYTLSDDNAESLHYERGIEPTNGVETIINIAVINWSGGQVTVKDQTSVDAYGPRDFSVNTAAPSAAVAQNIGEYLIAQYAEPTDRFETVTLNPAADSRTWTAAMDVQVGDRITIERTPQETGAAIVQESIVEAKKWDISDGIDKAEVELTLSPADTTRYWIWDTSEWGESTDPTTRWG